MRRILALMLCLLLTAGSAYAEEVLLAESLLPEDCLPLQILPPEAAMQEADALQTGIQALIDHHPAADTTDAVCHAHRVSMSSGAVCWVASIFTQEGNYPLEAVVTIDEQTGAILRYEENNIGWFRQTQAHWEIMYGDYGIWPLERQALFDELYCIETVHLAATDGLLNEQTAYELALDASDLRNSRATLHFERALIHDLYAEAENERYVWMITICLEDVALAQVNISATDAHIIDCFDLHADVG